MRQMNSCMQNAKTSRINNCGADNTCRRLLKKLREYDFAIVETALFLDTHPNNRKALAYYTKLRDERAALAAEYEKNVGPITICGNKSDSKWDWITGPWPWEGEC